MTESSLETKQSWGSLADVESVKVDLERLGSGPDHIVEVRLPAEDVEVIEEMLLDSRPARVLYEDQLGWFNAKIVELVMPDSTEPDG